MNAIIIFLASYLYLIIIALAGIAFLSCTEKVKFAFTTGIAFPLAYFFGKVLGTLIHSPRPFMVDHIQPLIHAATDNGFPSDHVLLTATISLIVLHFNKRLGLVLCILTVLVGIGRVLAHAHHPIDVVGSLAISLITVFVAHHIVIFFKLKKNLLRQS